MFNTLYDLVVSIKSKMCKIIHLAIEMFAMGSFFYALKKIFELDALKDNTFKENGEKLGRKSIEMRKRTC